MPLRSIPVDSLNPVLEGLNHLDMGITVFDEHQRLVVANCKFLEMYGYPEEMAEVGIPYETFVRISAERGSYGPGHIEEQIRARLDAAKQQDGYTYELSPDDQTTFKVAVHPLPQGGLIITHSDISAITRQRESLRQKTQELLLSEERLSLIADEVPAGIAHLDRHMNFLYTNKRFAAAYRKTPAEVIGLNASELLPAKTLAESARFFEQARRGILVDFEMRIGLPGERVKDIRTLLRPDFRSGEKSLGEVIGFYLVSIDVSRRKSTMSALMRSQKMDALGRMASGISHDFNNLLTIILGNLVALEDQTEDQSVIDEYLSPSIAAARRGSSLTKRLVALARREQFDPQPTDIGEAIAEITNLVEASIPTSLKVRLEQAVDLPQANVDRSQLEMAVLNLALNARDATEGAGQLRITTDSYQLLVAEAEVLRVPTGEYVRIRVTDDGCGMAPELSEKIFEPFFTSKAAGSGSGLGLSMVYGFVQQSNGAICVESAAGKGTTFTILLPSESLSEDAYLPLMDWPLPDEDEDDTAFIPPLTETDIILLVEDDLDVRRTIRRKIAGLGYPMVEASSAPEALDLLSRVPDIKAVVSDIDMPGGANGIELAKSVRVKFPQIRMILMSGDPRFSGGRVRLRDVPFLEKPFSEQDLQDALGKTTRATEQEEQTL